MLGLAISIWQGILGGTTTARLGPDASGGSAGQPIGLLLVLTKAS